MTHPGLHHTLMVSLMPYVVQWCMICTILRSNIYVWHQLIFYVVYKYSICWVAKRYVFALNKCAFLLLVALNQHALTLTVCQYLFCRCRRSPYHYLVHLFWTSGGGGVPWSQCSGWSVVGNKTYLVKKFCLVYYIVVVQSKETRDGFGHLFSQSEKRCFTPSNAGFGNKI